MLTLAEHRQKYPALNNKIYLNYGVQGPMSRATLAAFTAYYERKELDGPMSEAILAQAVVDEDVARAALAKTLRAQPYDIALSDATCTGLNAVLAAIAWEAGDELIIGDAEYPAMLFTAQLLHQRYGVVVKNLEVAGRGEQAPELVAKALTARTRAVLLSQVFWCTGDAIDVAAVAQVVRRQGRALLLVDGAQGPGNVAVDLAASDVDVYAFACFKGLGGPEGLAGLYVKKSVAESLVPPTVGWRALRYDGAHRPLALLPDARRFEASTTSFGNRPAIVAALADADHFAAVDVRVQRAMGVAHDVWRELAAMKGVETFLPHPPQSTLITFRVTSGNHADLVKRLAQQGVVARHLTANDLLRFSVSYLTLESEVETTIRVLAKLVRAN